LCFDSPRRYRTGVPALPLHVQGPAQTRLGSMAEFDCCHRLHSRAGTSLPLPVARCIRYHTLVEAWVCLLSPSPLQSMPVQLQP
jgi:hypothetical protein